MKLHDALEAGTRFAPHYLPSMNSDHLPMTLAAMTALGATESQRDEFSASYATRLNEWQPGPEVSSWEEGVGRLECYPSLMGFYRHQLSLHPVTALLDSHLPTFLPGLALDAFHPLIRLGYAVDFDSSAEIAAALAYMTIVHHELPVSTQPLPGLHDRLCQQAEEGPVPVDATRFGAAILELAETGRYPQGSATGLEEIAREALLLYQSTRNFFALHLVTATQALRCVVTLTTESLAVASMTGAMLAAHLVLKSPGFSDRPLPAPSQLDPEHALKYLWTCLSEYRRYGWPEYLEEIRLFRGAGLVPDWAAADLFD